MLPAIRPAALRPGDTIAFVAPAGGLDRDRMELARKRLEACGFQVKVPDDLFRRRGYLAGTDEARAGELMAAFRDPQVRAIFPGTGGYGATRILDRLDYEAIRSNPKILIGFSDITALHLAIQKKTGLITFHSPNPIGSVAWRSSTLSMLTVSSWAQICRPLSFPSGHGGSTRLRVVSTTVSVFCFIPTTAISQHCSPMATAANAWSCWDFAGTRCKCSRASRVIRLCAR